MGWTWIFWVALIVLIVLIVRRASTASRPSTQSSISAEEILKRGYARDEVSEEEYERKLEDLRKWGSRQRGGKAEHGFATNHPFQQAKSFVPFLQREI
jgi:putative membrane protein